MIETESTDENEVLVASCSVSSFAGQLALVSASLNPKELKAKFNPRPPGVYQPGSATDKVFAFLTESPGLKTELQIRWATKLGHSAVSWALLRLRSWGKVQAVSDPSRNSRYLRYRACQPAKESQS